MYIVLSDLYKMATVGTHNHREVTRRVENTVRFFKEHFFISLRYVYLRIFLRKPLIVSGCANIECAIKLDTFYFIRVQCVTQCDVVVYDFCQNVAL